jgi:cytidylate kinase
VKKINIAVDGHAGCGKSSTAKQVALRLNYLFIDSGAMYRAVSLFFLRHGVNFQSDGPAVEAALKDIFIDFVHKVGKDFPEVRLNGEEVEGEIRKAEVSAIVSPVSVLGSVREAMVAQQQRMGADKGVIMDGRDIGTVVFPDAELKVFMTAEVEVRARRRLAEMEAKGLQASLEEVVNNLQERDHIDSTREVGPLRQAEDAIVIDTTYLTLEEQIEQVYNLAMERILS